MLTEAAGIPLGLVVDGANRHDVTLLSETLASVPHSVEDKRLVYLIVGEQEQGLCMDAGYDSAEVREVAQAFGYTTHIRSRGEEKQAKEEGKKARRWVGAKRPGERTHSWLNRYRRLLVRWEKKGRNYLALLHFACALLTWNRALFG